jgi:hypothetical protein
MQGDIKSIIGHANSSFLAKLLEEVEQEKENSTEYVNN